MDYDKLSKEELVSLLFSVEKKLEKTDPESFTLISSLKKQLNEAQDKIKFKQTIIEQQSSTIKQQNNKIEQQNIKIEKQNQKLKALTKVKKEIENELKKQIKEKQKLEQENLKTIIHNILIEIKEREPVFYEYITSKFGLDERFFAADLVAVGTFVQRIIMDLCDVLFKLQRYCSIYDFNKSESNKSKVKSNNNQKELNVEDKAMEDLGKEQLHNTTDAQLDTQPNQKDDNEENPTEEKPPFNTTPQDELDNSDKEPQDYKTNYINAEYKDIICNFEDKNNTADELLDKGCNQVGNCADSDAKTHEREEATKRLIKRHDSNIIGGVISLEKGSKVKHYCEVCKTTQDHTITSIKRNNTVITKNHSKINSTISAAYTAKCDCCNNTIDLNPVEMYNFNCIENPQVAIFGMLRNNFIDQNLVSQTLTNTVSQTPTNTAQSPEESHSLNTNQNDTNSIKHSDNDITENTTNDTEDLNKTSQAQVISPESEQKIRDCELKMAAIEVMLDNDKLSKSQRQNLLVKRSRLVNEVRDVIRKEIINSPNKVERNFDLTKILCNDSLGNEVINPYEFDEEAFGYTPCFMKSKLSVGLATSMGELFGDLSMPKSRIFGFLQQLGLNASKAQVIGWQIAFARAFLRPVSNQIKKDLLSQSTAVLMDETPIKIRTHYTENGRIKKSYVWTVVTSRTAPIQAAYYVITPGRKYSTVVELLKDASDVLQFLTTDFYSGYDKAVQELKEDHGVEITHTGCLTHLRRPLHVFLERSGLLEIYQELISRDEDFSKFNIHLKDYMEHPTKVPLTEKEKNLLIAYYLINCLYAIDSQVVAQFNYNTQSEAFKEALLEARQKRSRVIINALYDVLRIIVLNNSSEFTIKKHKVTGKLYYQGTNLFSDTKAIAFILNNEDKMKIFIDHPDVELHQSSAELRLRCGSIAAKKAFYFLDSQEGAESFCDYQTIINTCRMNNVSVSSYLNWLVANIRYRLISWHQEGYDDPSMFTMPGALKVTGFKQSGKKVTEKISMYDPRNNTCYDKISLNGLMPYDYARLLREKKPANKQVGEGYMTYNEA